MEEDPIYINILCTYKTGSQDEIVSSGYLWEDELTGRLSHYTFGHLKV